MTIFRFLFFKNFQKNIFREIFDVTIRFELKITFQNKEDLVLEDELMEHDDI
jgi:hypothetical protein